MWAEQLNPDTVDSRVWPRTLAIAERFWSQQTVRDAPDMYRRLRIATLRLEDVGLTHISGPHHMRRSLMGSLDTEPLDVLASVIEPVSFHERYQGQKTDSLTALDRLVDAVVADPPSRQAIAAEMNALLTGDRAATEIRLRRRFLQWQQAAPMLEAWAHRSIRLSDIEARAHQLGALAQVGLDSLAYLDTRGQPAAGWQDAQLAVITDAEKPSALVRFVFLPEMRKLVEEAARSGKAE